MRDNSFDRTIERNYIQKWRFLIAEYEEVKAGRSQKFARVGEFYQHHGTCSQTFRKYYNRYLRSGAEADLLPQRRGPKWKTRRMPAEIEKLVVEQRQLGLNRYEIYAVLRERGKVTSLSAIYRALVRAGLNRRSKPMLEEKRRIIKEKLGELGHVDLQRRAFEHREGLLTGFSAKYGCKILVWYEVHDSMIGAITREKQIKAGSRAKKLALIEALNPDWKDLYESLA